MKPYFFIIPVLNQPSFDKINSPIHTQTGNFQIVMKILLDGTEIENMVNQQPKEYLNVKIYTGNPWNTPANATYRNFCFENIHEADVCPEEWTSYGGSCFKYFYTPTNWNSAKDYCLQYQVS